MLEQRFDPLYYYADIKKYKHCTYSEKLSDIDFSLTQGFAVGRQDQVEEGEGILQIRPTNIDNNGRLKYDKMSMFQKWMMFRLWSLVLFCLTIQIVRNG